MKSSHLFKIVPGQCVGDICLNMSFEEEKDLLNDDFVKEEKVNSTVIIF